MTTYQPKTARDLLLDLGVGGFNATMLIETLMMTPATTEAASAPVMMLVQHLQRIVKAMGAPIPALSGIIDDPTNAALERVVGPNWLFRTWFDVCREVVAAQRAGKTLAVLRAAAAKPVDSGIGFLDLPDVPGGLLTYAAGAYVLYRVLKKKRS